MTTTADPGVSGGQGSPGVVASSDQGSDFPTVNHVVAVAVLLGTAAVATAFALGDPRSGVFAVPWIEGYWLHLLLLAMTCLCMLESVGVRLRHDDEGNAVEELTLLDGVVLLSTLLLPIREALAITLGGILLTYLVRRLPLVKLLFNLGVYASASTATALLVGAVVPSEGGFDLRLIVAMLLAASAFVTINLLHTAVLLRAIARTRPIEMLREDAGLSLLTVVGTVGLTGTVLAMGVATPVLLPCAVLPAIALRFAFGASAAKHEERRRSARVLAYSQVLASGPTRDVAIGAFLHMVQQEFDATATLVVLDDGTGLATDSSLSATTPVGEVTDLEPLLELPDLRVVEAAGLPRGWHCAMSAPLTVDGRRVGTALVAGGGRSRFRPRDLTTLSSLVTSLAVALSNADQMIRLVAETSKLRAVVDQAGDGIVVLGQDGVVQVWSPAMARLTGVPEAEAVGATLCEVVEADVTDHEQVDPFSERARRLSPDSPHYTVDVAILRRDGERRATRFSHAAVFHDGVLTRDVVIVRDLTAEWQVQRMKSDFIATVSHELRTPLTPIKGYASMLRKRADEMPVEKRNRALDVIVDRAEHLGRLVEDLLAASSITADQGPRHAMTTDRADLVALVSRTCEDFPAATGRLRLDQAPHPVAVIGDSTRVVQVLSNLVSNALKYSPADRPVHVTLGQRDGLAVVAVRDEGAGIPADQLERIFDKFHRVEDPMVMSTGGTGLGLYIARQLAQAMGGDISTVSTVGSGSTFTLTLPVAPPEAV